MFIEYLLYALSTLHWVLKLAQTLTTSRKWYWPYFIDKEAETLIFKKKTKKKKHGGKE